MKQLENIMQREMTRKEFLGALGFGLASIFGLSTVVKLVFGKSGRAPISSAYGYGDSIYGGRK